MRPSVLQQTDTQARIYDTWFYRELDPGLVNEGGVGRHGQRAAGAEPCRYGRGVRRGNGKNTSYDKVSLIMQPR